MARRIFPESQTVVRVMSFLPYHCLSLCPNSCPNLRWTRSDRCPIGMRRSYGTSCCPIRRGRAVLEVTE
jgi:hypothetical protein